MFHVAVVGAGAIGNPIAWGLSLRKDLAPIQLIDGDVVERSNLARQPWFGEDDIGCNKAVTLAARLAGGETPLYASPEMLTQSNREILLADADIVMDATDNWEARLVIQEWAERHHRPWIFNSAVRLEGMSTRLDPGGPCLRCWFDTKETQGPACFEAGVLGSVTLAVAGRALLLLDDWIRQGSSPDQGTLWLIDRRFGSDRSIHSGPLRCDHGGHG